jgi:hypothetical protein
MATFYLKSGAGATEFATSTAYTVGQKIVPKITDNGSNYRIARSWVWECTTGGTSAGANPTWPSSVTQDVTTVSSGASAVFTARKPGYSSGTTANWAFAAIYLHYLCDSGYTLPVAGDTIYVSNNHAESCAAGGGTMSFPTSVNNPVNVICVSDSAAPPTAAATTASVTWNSNGAATINGSCYWYGITFAFGNGQVANNNLSFGQYIENELQVYEKCKFVNTATGTGISTVFGPSGRAEARLYKFIDTTFKFAGGSSAFSPANVRMQCIGTGASLLDGAGSIPATLVRYAANGADVSFEGLDLSQFGSGKYLVRVDEVGHAKSTFRNCKLGASVAITQGTAVGLHEIVVDNCDSADTNYRKAYSTFLGTAVHETTKVRTSGASDGTTALSWKLDSNTLTKFPAVAFASPEIVKWNASTSSITVTVEYLHDTNVAAGQGAGTASAFQNDEVYLEVQYLGTSGFPQSVFSKSSKASILATAADNSTGVGTGGWTTTGMTTPKSGKVSVTFTPTKAGFIHAKVYLAKASKTIYVDPMLTVT